MSFMYKEFSRPLPYKLSEICEYCEPPRGAVTVITLRLSSLSPCNDDYDPISFLESSLLGR